MPSQPEAPAPVTTPQTGTQTEGASSARSPAAEPRRAAGAARRRSRRLSEPTQEPVATASRDPASRSPASTPSQRNDTLWRIASRVRSRDRVASINRTMIALFRANPAAFNGNINRLRAGSVLRIPELSEIEAISTGEATAEVARQTAEWSGRAADADRAGRSESPAAGDARRNAVAPPSATPAPEQVAQAPSTRADDAGADAARQSRRSCRARAWPRPSRASTETPVEAAASGRDADDAQPTEPAAETPPTTSRPRRRGRAAAPAACRRPPSRRRHCSIASASTGGC